MTEAVIAAIEAVLARDERVELIRGPDKEIKVLRVRRETVPIGKGDRTCGKK